MSLDKHDNILISALAACIQGKAHVEHRSVSYEEPSYQSHYSESGAHVRDSSSSYTIELRSIERIAIHPEDFDLKDYDVLIGYLLGFRGVVDMDILTLMKAKLDLPKGTEDAAVWERAAIYFGSKLKEAEKKTS